MQRIDFFTIGWIIANKISINTLQPLRIFHLKRSFAPRPTEIRHTLRKTGKHAGRILMTVHICQRPMHTPQIIMVLRSFETFDGFEVITFRILVATIHSSVSRSNLGIYQPLEVVMLRPQLAGEELGPHHGTGRLARMARIGMHLTQIEIRCRTLLHGAVQQEIINCRADQRVIVHLDAVAVERLRIAQRITRVERLAAYPRTIEGPHDSECAVGLREHQAFGTGDLPAHMQSVAARTAKKRDQRRTAGWKLHLHSNLILQR